MTTSVALCLMGTEQNEYEWKAVPETGKTEFLTKGEADLFSDLLQACSTLQHNAVQYNATLLSIGVRKIAFWFVSQIKHLINNDKREHIY